MGYIDTVVTELGVHNGELYSQLTSKFMKGGVRFTRTSRFMTRPDGRYFNIMRGEDIGYDELPVSIQKIARKPVYKAVAEESDPLTQKEIDYFAALHSGITEGEWVKLEKDGAITYMPEEQYSPEAQTMTLKPTATKYGGLAVVGVCIFVLWYFLLGRMRRG